jgi:hypothetical protein
LGKGRQYINKRPERLHRNVFSETNAFKRPAHLFGFDTSDTLIMRPYQIAATERIYGKSLARIKPKNGLRPKVVVISGIQQDL